jgi:hypothetical protein
VPINETMDQSESAREWITGLLGATPEAETLASHVERIERQLDAARKALRFYADEANWSLADDMDSVSAVEEDHGARARAASAQSRLAFDEEEP